MAHVTVPSIFRGEEPDDGPRDADRVLRAILQTDNAARLAAHCKASHMRIWREGEMAAKRVVPRPVPNAVPNGPFGTLATPPVQKGLKSDSGSARAGRFKLANGRHLPYQKLGVKPPRPYAPRW
jgi:hypothetical protein